MNRRDFSKTTLAIVATVAVAPTALHWIDKKSFSCSYESKDGSISEHQIDARYRNDGAGFYCSTTFSPNCTRQTKLEMMEQRFAEFIGPNHYLWEGQAEFMTRNEFIQVVEKNRKHYNGVML